MTVIRVIDAPLYLEFAIKRVRSLRETLKESD